MRLKFREARVAAGFTLREAGKRLGKTASALQKWESGMNSPTVPDIYRMSDLYRVQIGALLGESGAELTPRQWVDQEYMTIDALLDEWSRRSRITAEKERAKQLAELARVLPYVPVEFAAHWVKALKACAAAVSGLSIVRMAMGSPRRRPA